MPCEWWIAFEDWCGARVPPHAVIPVPFGLKRIEEAPGYSIVPSFLVITNAACPAVAPLWKTKRRTESGIMTGLGHENPEVWRIVALHARGRARRGGNRHRRAAARAGHRRRVGLSGRHQSAARRCPAGGAAGRRVWESVRRDRAAPSVSGGGAGGRPAGPPEASPSGR